jgi:hypothetical protein
MRMKMPKRTNETKGFPDKKNSTMDNYHRLIKALRTVDALIPMLECTLM